MTQKSSKTLTPRTEKELAFFLEYNTIPLTQAMWEWMALQGQLGTEVEIDLEEFQKFVERHRQAPFARWWMINRFRKLIETRVVQVIKEFKSTAYRIILRPIDWLNPRKKNQQKHLRNLNSSCDLDPSNPQSAEEGVNNNNISTSKISEEQREELQKILQVVKICEQHGYQPHAPIFNLSIEEIKADLECWSSQQYEELERRYDILKLCADYGIYYHPDKRGTQELYLYSIDEVELALKHFVKSSGLELRSDGKPFIRNPEGWLIDCLRDSWWQTADLSEADWLAVIDTFLPKHVPRDYF